jgi:hypothetical protein
VIARGVGLLTRRGLIQLRDHDRDITSWLFDRLHVQPGTGDLVIAHADHGHAAHQEGDPS